MTANGFFLKLPKGTRRSGPDRSRVHLLPSNWDDYSYKTSFSVVFFDANGTSHEVGTTKIGFQGQPKGWTHDHMEESFESLPQGWFSLGQDVDYYRALMQLGEDARARITQGLRDVVINESTLTQVQDEEVYQHSLLRGVSNSVISGQYRRVLNRDPILTDFSFIFEDSERDDQRPRLRLKFEVHAESKPSTNIHVLIGRNGVGKTTLLNRMAEALVGAANGETSGRFREEGGWLTQEELSPDYFGSVVSVSFSAFDPFVPPPNRPPDRSHGPAYFYVGMKRRPDNPAATTRPALKSSEELVEDFLASFESCLSQEGKRRRWLESIRRLESDINFAEKGLAELVEMETEAALDAARERLRSMSSGHQIVLLTVTQLTDTVEEKTLVLMDEPESHLHPPLLSAFARALSDLLYSRNGVAIIATHSPVLLQEVPRSCVWKITRIGDEARADRPELETFGENVGILTREVFGLEVSNSGFHALLERDVQAGGSFTEILGRYDGQLGLEGQSVLRALLAARDAPER